MGDHYPTWEAPVETWVAPTDVGTCRVRDVVPMKNTTTSCTSFDRLVAGPPFAANGGVVVGRMAARMGRWSGFARISGPVPLDSDVDVAVSADETSISLDDRVLATLVPASPSPVDLPVVAWDDAVVAAARADTSDHPFPECVVCGPDAPRGMGLTAGPVPGGVAAPWTPPAWQAAPNGAVSPEWVLAALDCPSGLAVVDPGEAILLGSMAFSIRRRPVVGERLVVTGRKVSRRGRKRNAASAVHDASGAVVAYARTIWLSVDAAQVQRSVAA